MPVSHSLFHVFTSLQRQDTGPGAQSGLLHSTSFMLLLSTHLQGQVQVQMHLISLLEYDVAFQTGFENSLTNVISDSNLKIGFVLYSTVEVHYRGGTRVLSQDLLCYSWHFWRKGKEKTTPNPTNK